MISKKQIAQSVGKELRRQRTKKKLSQEELAHKAGLYRTYIGHIEVGRYMPSVYTIYKISQALKVKSSDLLPY